MSRLRVFEPAEWSADEPENGCDHDICPGSEPPRIDSSSPGCRRSELEEVAAKTMGVGSLARSWSRSREQGCEPSLRSALLGRRRPSPTLRCRQAAR